MYHGAAAAGGVAAPLQAGQPGGHRGDAPARPEGSPRRAADHGGGAQRLPPAHAGQTAGADSAECSKVDQGCGRYVGHGGGERGVAMHL